MDLSLRNRSSIILWLLSGCLLIFMMVVVGGITRLTGSGLSITKWNVVTGTIPPLNEEQWHKEFDLYKQSPQYRKINAHFELSDFKGIYWWEYLHRLLGRLIGIVFLIPFLYFCFTKKLDRTLLIKTLFLFFLGGLQGFIGWYMVESGLVDIPSVSHLRLALHLVTAFITFGFTFWFALDLIHPRKVSMSSAQRKIFNFSIMALSFTVLQIIYGAFTAGLKAGYIYNTWPMMQGQWIADSFYFGLEKNGWQSLINDLSGVQVIHRYLAMVVTLIVVILYLKGRKQWKTHELNDSQWMAVKMVTLFLTIQFLLGIFTLLYSVPILLGVLHQMGAFFLFASILYLLHRLQRGSALQPAQ